MSFSEAPSQEMLLERPISPQAPGQKEIGHEIRRPDGLSRVPGLRAGPSLRSGGKLAQAPWRATHSLDEAEAGIVAEVRCRAGLRDDVACTWQGQALLCPRGRV